MYYTLGIGCFEAPFFGGVTIFALKFILIYPMLSNYVTMVKYALIVQIGK